MAKLGPPISGGLPVSVHSAYYVRTWRGKVIAQSQDRHHRNRISKATKLARDKLKASVWAIKIMDAASIRQAINELADTQILWRDALTAGIYGTLYPPIQTERGRLYPERFLQLVDRALDHAIGHRIGTTATRATSTWTRLASGSPGQRLTSNGPGKLPTWK